MGASILWVPTGVSVCFLAIASLCLCVLTRGGKYERLRVMDSWRETISLDRALRPLRDTFTKRLDSFCFLQGV